MTRSVYTLCGFEKNKPVGFCVFCEFCGNYDKGTITRRITTKGTIYKRTISNNIKKPGRGTSFSPVLYKSFVVVDVYRSPNERLYLITMFTIFFGTTITLTTFLSPMYLALCSSASTASWMASLVASAGNFFWKRALPLKDMVS